MGIDSIPGLNQSVLKSPSSRDEGAKSSSGKSNKDTAGKSAIADQVASAAARVAERGDIASHLDADQALELAEATARDIAGSTLEAAIAVHGRQDSNDLLPLLSS